MALRATRRTRRLNPGVYARPDGRYQAHIIIPADVRFAYGREKLVRSLGTDDAEEANRRHAKMVADLNAAFDLLRRGTASKAFEAFARRLHESQAEVIDLAAENSIRRHSDNGYLSGSWRDRLDSQNPEELGATVGWAADWFYAEQLGIDPDHLPSELRSSLAYRQVLRECAEVLKDSWLAGREAEEGRTISPPRYPALRKKSDESPDGNRATDDRATWTLSKYHDEVYLPAKAGEIEPHTAKTKRQTINLFTDLIGDPLVYLLSRSQIADFQDKLKVLPDGRLITGELRDKSLREIAALQASGGLDLKRQGAATIDKHVRNIKAILAFAVERGHVRLNPTVGMRNVKPTAANAVSERRPFTRRELQSIFAHPLFSGCESDTGRGLYRPGDTLIRDERFWIPILLFLTGARAKEVAGLEKADVTIEGDKARIVFRFSPLRRLKNPESERVIPLHPWAMRMGFADFVASLPSQTPYLFPNVVSSARDKASGEMSDDRLNGTPLFRQFNRTLLKHVGLADDPNATLHSFRHVFEDAMTGRDIPEEVMFRLTGRTVGGSRRIYAKSLPLDEDSRARRAADYLRHVERIDFGGLDISHLYGSHSVL